MYIGRSSVSKFFGEEYLLRLRRAHAELRPAKIYCLPIFYTVSVSIPKKKFGDSSGRNIHSDLPRRSKFFLRYGLRSEFSGGKYSVELKTHGRDRKLTRPNAISAIASFSDPDL
jgi:hypothetical protein